jgi:hypothetical protein
MINRIWIAMNVCQEAWAGHVNASNAVATVVDFNRAGEGTWGEEGVAKAGNLGAVWHGADGKKLKTSVSLFYSE